MKNKISVLVAASVTLGIWLSSASAGLIGMPLNLRIAAVQLADVDAQTPACQFYTDDVLTGPLLVKGC
ncbi:MAG: hypothetical protein QOF22_1665 [Bradyrhizobium sp.]|jgi:hypothetical protein|nr:hypothetical protein [Bradyrhizobium sp.]